MMTMESGMMDKDENSDTTSDYQPDVMKMMTNGKKSGMLDRGENSDTTSRQPDMMKMPQSLM